MKYFLIVLSVFLLSGCYKQLTVDEVVDNLQKSGKLDKAIDEAITKRIKKEQENIAAQREAAENQKQELAKNIRPVDSTDYVYGNKDAKYTIILFNDLECPYCQQFAGVPEKIVDSNPNDINLVMRHFPLEFHNPVAISEAVATECVAKQSGSKGYYGFAHDVLTKTRSNGKGLPQGETDIVTLAKNNGVKSVTDFKSCFKNSDIASKVLTSIEEGKKIGISGTPSMVIYNNQNKKTKMIVGALPEQELVKQILNF